MENIDFIKLVDIIFKNKEHYDDVKSLDKEKNFFIINRKFSIGKLKQSQFLNNKFVDKECALDLWFHYFENENSIPGWYWKKTPFKKDKDNKKISNPDLNFMKKYYNLKDYEINFLLKYYKDSVDYELKKLKRFDDENI